MNTAAHEIVAIVQPEGADAWALDPRPMGPTIVAEARKPRKQLHNTPWAVLGPMAAADEDAEAEESQGGGHEE